MSSWFNWLWSMPEDERKRASSLQAQVLEELKVTFEQRNLKELAERRYDFQHVLNVLTEAGERLASFYIKNGDGWSYWRVEDEPAIKEAAEKWLDIVVEHRDFVHDHPILLNRIEERIRELQQEEGLRFDWHYWQLFHKELPPKQEQ